MKTQFKVMLLLLSLIFMGAICSCDKKSSDKDDDDKDDDNVENVKFDKESIQKLTDKYYEEGWTEDEYSKALDIYEKVGDEYVQKAKSLLNKCQTREEFDNQLGKSVWDSDDFQNLRTILERADVSEMGKKNYARFMKIVDQNDSERSKFWKLVSEKFDGANAEASYSDGSNSYSNSGYNDYDSVPTRNRFAPVNVDTCGYDSIRR